MVLELIDREFKSYEEQSDALMCLKMCIASIREQALGIKKEKKRKTEFHSRRARDTAAGFVGEKNFRLTWEVLKTDWGLPPLLFASFCRPF